MYDLKSHKVLNFIFVKFNAIDSVFAVYVFFLMTLVQNIFLFLDYCLKVSGHWKHYTLNTDDWLILID